MPLKLFRFATILLVALLSGLTFAHVLEQPAKMQYDAALYITLQKSLYVQWDPPECSSHQRLPQPVSSHSSCVGVSAVCGSPWARCSRCYWRFRSSSSGWSLPRVPSFSLQRCRAFRLIGQTCVQTGKWAMPFVLRFSLGRSHCLFYPWHSTRIQLQHGKIQSVVTIIQVKLYEE